MKKKGISLFVSYAILIAIAVSLAVLTYAYLKLYLPSQRAECPADTGLFIDDVVCTRNNFTIIVTLSNKGLFNVSAAYIRFGEEQRAIRYQLNPRREVFPLQISPEERAYQFSYYVKPFLKANVADYIVEVQPAVLYGKKLVTCEEYTSTYRVYCA